MYLVEISLNRFYPGLRAGGRVTHSTEWFCSNWYSCINYRIKIIAEQKLRKMVSCSFCGRSNASLMHFVFLVFIIISDLSECGRQTSLHLTLPRILYKSPYYEYFDDQKIARTKSILGGLCNSNGCKNNLISLKQGLLYVLNISRNMKYAVVA